jgi:cell division protein FtsZ
LKPWITVFGVGGAGGNAVNNILLRAFKGSIRVANTDAQATTSRAERIIQMGVQATEGHASSHGCRLYRRPGGDRRIRDLGGRSYGVRDGRDGRRHRDRRASSVVAKAARDLGILTSGCPPFPFRRPAPHAACRGRHPELQKTVTR